MSLVDKTPAETYKDLLKVTNSNNGVDGTARSLSSGDGSASCLSVSTNDFAIKPSSDSTSVFKVKDKDNNTKFVVDTTNDQVKALGHHVNTQYARFGIGSGDTANYVINTHHPIPFFSNSIGSTLLQDNITFGTSTEPASTFTTADAAATDAGLLVPMLWYVPDNISIDKVTSLEGANNATGDTTRMHLFSYTFTSGATECLTSGTLLAHNTDVTNAGSEQPYLSTWTVDSASVSAGKVILAFFKSDSINSDYSLNIKVKYHLT